MAARIRWVQVAPEAYKALSAVESYAANSSVGKPLVELIKLRVSQINGCAYCIDMHWKDLRAGGETEQRLYGLDAWEESPYYTPRERAALEWAEAVTTLGHERVSDRVYEVARSQFNERELVDLTMAIVAINSWNRLGIAFRAEAGAYVPRRKHE
jgi:AhpD family alkylhydroperoxidase